MRKKFLVFAISLAMIFGLMALAPESSLAAGGTQLPANSVTSGRTIQQVYALYSANQADKSYSTSGMFATAPVLKQSPSYKPGKLSEEAISKTLGQLNYYRELYGVNHDIAADPNNFDWGQYGATGMNIVNQLTHHFTGDQLQTLLSYMEYQQSDLNAGTQPAVTSPTELGKARLAISAYYDNDYLWNGNCDGPNNVVTAVEDYVDDSYNVSSGVGHRENMFDIRASVARFGAGLNNYSCMQLGEEINQTSNPNTQAYYAWPCEGYFPKQELPDGALWSIAFSKDYKFQNTTDPASGVNITLTYKDNSYNGTVITAENNYSDQYPCISFELPENLQKAIASDSSAYNYAGEADVTVKVTGLVDSSSSPVYAEYKTRLFKQVPVHLNSISVSDSDGQTSGSVYSGKTKKLTVTYDPADTTDNKTASWSSSDENIATVSDEGVVTGHAEGTAVITATVGDKTAAYNVAVSKIPLSGCTVEDIAAQTYDGSAKKPSVTVKDGDKTLQEGTDYTADYSDNTNAGTATAALTGKGSYKGTITKRFVINPKNGDHFTIDPIDDQVYTGSVITPAVTIRDGDQTLNRTDYVVSYGNNTNAGEATVEAKLQGNYTGSAKAAFKIIPKTLTINNIAGIADQTYTGSEITPSLTVRDGLTTLTQGEDYSVEFTGNVNAGKAKVMVTGKKNYQGTVEKTFKITPKQLPANAVEEISAQTYSGAALEPEVTVKDGDKTLQRGTDYEVTYSDNVNAGTASAVITGKGNYAGKQTVKFAIKQKTLQAEFVQDIQDQKYTGSEITPAVTVKDGEETLQAGTDYEVFFKDNIEKGEAVATIKGKGNYTGSVEKKFRIAVMVSDEEETGLREQIAEALDSAGIDKPESIGAIRIDDTVLEEGRDYEVTYSGFGKPGVATVTVTFKGDYSGVVTVTKVIPKYRRETKVSSKTLNYKYGAGSFDLGRYVTVSGGDLKYSSSDSRVAQADASGRVKIAGPGIAVLTVSAPENDEYLAASVCVKIRVAPQRAKLGRLKSTKKKTLKVTWRKCTRVSGYQVSVALNKKFSKGRKTYTVKNTSKTIKKLKSKKKYYVRVRAYKKTSNGKIYGQYSKVKTVKVK